MGASLEAPDEYSGAELSPPRIVTRLSSPEEDEESLRVVRLVFESESLRRVRRRRLRRRGRSSGSSSLV